jgi:hypothetical protein
MISSIIYGSAKHLLESCSDEITHFLTCSQMRQFRVCLEIWTFQGWISYPWFLLKLDGDFLLVGSFSQKLWICFSIIETLGIVIVALYVRCFFRGHHIVWVLPRLSQMSLHLRSHTDFTYVQDKHDMYVMVTCIFAMKVNCKVLKIFPQF